MAITWSAGTQTVPETPVTDTLAVMRPVALRMPHNATSPAALTAVFGDTITRQKAVVLSDWYGRRLTVHRYGSYLMLPLFAAEYLLGRELLAQKEGVYDCTRREPVDEDLRNTHRNVAMGIGSLFVVNTTTGLWNLWEIRHDGSATTRRTLHVLTMLAADAGFVATGVMGAKAVDGRPPEAKAHRNMALASMGLATIGVSLMWF